MVITGMKHIKPKSPKLLKLYEPAHSRWLFLSIKKVITMYLFMLLNKNLMKINYKNSFHL